MTAIEAAGAKGVPPGGGEGRSRPGTAFAIQKGGRKAIEPAARSEVMMKTGLKIALHIVVIVVAVVVAILLTATTTLS